MKLRILFASFVLLSLTMVSPAAEPDTSRGDAMLWEYFRQETQKLADACLADIETLDDWTSRRDEYRRQLLEMLGLDPLPEKTPLNAVVTGKVDHDEFTVENVHFQSRPRLYVTGNLYIPKGEGPFPAILYVCGHGPSVKDGVSYGNKVSYHHHGVWFARNGYVCLIIDTLQLGEIEGLHHGTYGRRVDGQWQHQWWWNSRGYTPAGVEAWNCVRALDYLETRPEVDAQRIGVTGRSGGGAYSWWIAAIDERIKCAVPVAGITDLTNHVVAGSPGRLADGCVEGHCDCMYIVNTYRWDYPLVAALVAPRPLLIANSDKDTIFPLDGVVRVHEKVRRIYRLYEKEVNLGLHITEGPHRDTQALRMGAFGWFNRHLKGQEPLIETAATKLFEPEQLKVFPVGELPVDETNTTIQETFVPVADAKVPENEADWERMREVWTTALKEKAFRGWPSEPEPLDIDKVFSATREGIELSEYEFTSQGPWRLRLHVARVADGRPPEAIVLMPLGEEQWSQVRPLVDAMGGEAAPLDATDAVNPRLMRSVRETMDRERTVLCYVTPRGVGSTSWGGDDRKQVQIRRRFMLLGQTLQGMQAWDIVRATQALGEMDQTRGLDLFIEGKGRFAETSLYASLFVPGVDKLTIAPSATIRHEAADLLNVQRFVTLDQAVALAVSRSPVVILQPFERAWDYPRQVADRLGWDADRLQVEHVEK